MSNPEVYEVCKKLVDNDHGYEALACLSKMLEERNTELEIMANHRLIVLDAVKRFTRVDNSATKKLKAIETLVKDE